MDTCYAYGTNPSLLRQRYHEAHDLVMRAWTEKDTFAFNGRFNQQRYVNIWPRPVQQPHPPIWIPGGGSVETWRWCAEMDYVYCYLSYYGYKAGRATMDGFWDEMERLGKDRNPYQRRLPAIRRRRRNPPARVRSLLPRRPNTSMAAACMSMRAGPRRPAIPARAASAPASKARSSRRRMPTCAANPPASASPRWRARWMRSSTRATSSSARPTRWRSRFREVATNLNVGHLMLLLQFGNMSKDLCRYNTRMFAEKVMPKLKDLFSEWEDRWWPQPMAAGQRAAVPAFMPKLAAE